MVTGDMGPPPARTSFKRSVPDDEKASSGNISKRAKPSRTTPAPALLTPTSPPHSTPDPSTIPALTQSFGQSTSSGVPRARKYQKLAVPSTRSNNINTTSSISTDPSTSGGDSMSASFRLSQEVSKSQPDPSSSNSPGQQQQHASSSTDSTSSITLVESINDIFNAPPNTLIIHACNTKGSWGGGIAKAFKGKYPAAFEVYKTHCQRNGGELVGQALLIPPHKEAGEEHFVGCLFTSVSKGREADSPAKILSATGPAMRHLLRQVQEHNTSHPGEEMSEVRMCKINSGLFKVPWEKTKDVIQAIPTEPDGIRQIKVISRSEDD